MVFERFRNFCRKSGALASVVGITFTALLTGCGNNPYPDEKKSEETVYYGSFDTPPKELDPQLAYTTHDVATLKHCYEALVDYDYMERPLKIVPQLAKKVPEPKRITDKDGKITAVVYSFELWDGVEFIDDPCFEQTDGVGREMTAYDFEYAFKRAADAKTNCPVFGSLCHIKGYKEYNEKIARIRKEMEAEYLKKNPDKEKAFISSKELYQRCGDLPGIKVTGKYSFDLILKDPYPQIIYWLAMRFICAIPHEAVDYYNGEKESDTLEPMDFMHRPVGTGPYHFDWKDFNPESKIVMVKNKKWWGLKHPERAPGMTSFPEKPCTEEDMECQAWTRKDAGRELCMIDRVELYKEKESLPRFSKFMQGYYDAATIPREKMDELLGAGDSLSPEMEAQGIRMVKDFGLDIYYVGFNMDDDLVGAPIKFKDTKLEENRKNELTKRQKLRQAMTLAIDYQNYLRIFYKNSAIDAQSLIPPGIPGFKKGYKNPFKQYDPELKKAKQLLEEAGYKNGIDPATGEPLKLTLVIGNTSAPVKLRFNSLVESWHKLGINVKLDSSEYNKFTQKIKKGSYHMFAWGWGADYPDPENFMFLLYGKNSKNYGETKPNAARYENPRYDFLFKKMETMADSESVTYEEKDQNTGLVRKVTRSRMEIIDEMSKILEQDCPWIPLTHSVNFIIYQSWLKNIKPHPQADNEFEYYRVVKGERSVKRKEWNKPILWPVFVLVIGMAIFLIPAAITIHKERR